MHGWRRERLVQSLYEEQLVSTILFHKLSKLNQRVSPPVWTRRPVKRSTPWRTFIANGAMTHTGEQSSCEQQAKLSVLTALPYLLRNDILHKISTFDH